MIETHFICRLDRGLYRIVSSDIATDEVIITEERIQHIKEHHPGDYEAYGQYLPAAIHAPDYIIKANRPNTALILKEIQDVDEVFKLVVRIRTSKDPETFHNSIITFMKTDKKEWARLLKNKKILYNGTDCAYNKGNK